MEGHKPKPDAPIFVVGFPRSGTTLVSYLLNDHPDQAMAPETHFLDLFLTKCRNRSFGNETDLRACWRDFTRGLANPFWAEFIGKEPFSSLGLETGDLYSDGSADDDARFRALFTALLRAYAASEGKPGIGEKTPDHYRHLATLFSWFPNARIIFLLRDPRAVVASYLRVTRQWTQGADTYAVAREWQSHLSHLQRWRTDPRVSVVRYEALVRGADAELPGILSFAGLRDESARILARPPAQPLGTGSFVGSAPVSDANVDAWRTRLSPRQIATVEGVLGTEMVSLGYPLDRPRVYSRGVAQYTRGITQLRRAGQRTRGLLGRVRPGAT